MKTLAAAAVVWVLVCGPALPADGEESGMPASIQEVKQRHEAELMAMPGVVSVGIGRGERGEPVLVIGLDRERRDLRERLPKRLEGYDVRTEIVGPIRAQ
jgi:hypothetical protein